MSRPLTKDKQLKDSIERKKKCEAKELEIVNFYKRIPNKDKPRSYPNEHLVNIKLPFRAVLVGPSGSGKTNLVLQLIKSIGVFDKIVLIAKKLDEPLYEHLIETCRKIEKKTGEKILLASNDLKDLPSPDDFDPKENNIVIIDDFICASEKELAPVSELWIRGRKNGVSCCFLTQRYFKSPIMIRQNSNIIMIKKIANMLDLGRILKDFELGVELPQLKKMYNEAVAAPDGDPLKHFFMIDIENPDPNLRFRKNFKGIKIE